MLRFIREPYSRIRKFPVINFRGNFFPCLISGFFFFQLRKSLKLVRIKFYWLRKQRKTLILDKTNYNKPYFEVARCVRAKWKINKFKKSQQISDSSWIEEREFLYFSDFLTLFPTIYLVGKAFLSPPPPQPPFKFPRMINTKYFSWTKNILLC